MSDGHLDLTVHLPGELMGQLEQAARNDLRTPEAEAAWLIRDGLIRLDTIVVNSRIRRDRLRDSTELRARLNAVIMEGGKPSHRAIARAASEQGCQISHTTVSEILRGAHFPSWGLVEAIAMGLGVNPAQFRPAWEKAAR
jgi:Helix-turn-helix domain